MGNRWGWSKGNRAVYFDDVTLATLMGSCSMWAVLTTTEATPIDRTVTPVDPAVLWLKYLQNVVLVPTESELAETENGRCCIRALYSAIHRAHQRNLVEDSAVRSHTHLPAVSPQIVSN